MTITLSGLKIGVSSVQPLLVSGTNLKTVNSTTLLGSGDVAVQATLVSGTNIKTVGGTSLLGSGDIAAGLTDVVVSGTTQTCAVGNAYYATNAALTAFTAPAASANLNKFSVVPSNGLATNTLDFGAATVRGSGGEVNTYARFFPRSTSFTVPATRKYRIGVLGVGGSGGASAQTTVPRTGGGFVDTNGAGFAGGSGFCRVTWFE